MTVRQPLPEAERARQTEDLIGRGETDIARWKDAQNLHSQWDARAAMAAETIPADMSVLDIGCGAMALARHLKPGCRYFPADVVARREGCQVIDLNKREFPQGTYDWITFLGVLEYVHDVPWPLARAHDAAPNLIATYCTHVGAMPQLRRGMGWVNDLTRPQFEALLSAAGWTLRSVREVKRSPTNIQMMFACARTA